MSETHFAEVAPGIGPASAASATLGWLVGVGALAVASSIFVVAGPIMEALAHVTSSSTEQLK